MNIIPQTAHTIFEPSSLKEPLEELFGINATEIHLLHHGMNDSYIVKTKVEEYIFRVSRLNWRTTDALQSEIEFLRELGKSRVDVCMPLPTKSGDWFCRVEAPEGIRLGTMFHRAPGNIPKELSPALCTSMGTALAQLHKALSDKTFDHRPTWDREALYTAPAKIISETFPDLDVANLVKDLGTVFPEWDDSTPMGWLHGDYIPVNLNIFVGEITLYDFDLCGHGPLAYDLACFKSTTNAYPQDSEDSWNLFIDAYERSGGPKTDDAIVDRLAIFRKFWVWAYNVQNGEDFRRLNAHSVEHHVNMFRQMINAVEAS